MAAQADTPKMNSIVNQQIEIIMLIVTPLVAILILTAPILINVLLTDEFNSVIVLIRWMGFGIFFKALAYPMSYISFSKGDKRTFFWLEGVSSNLVNIAISCSFYYIFGINGLGMSLTITCIIFNVVYIILTRRLYEFHFDKAVLKLVLKLCCFAVIVFVSSFIESVYIKYSIGIVTLILLSIYSLIELNKRIDLKETLRKITKRG
jgi:O-antigen/teichoic acid export membrane protein